MRALIYGDTNLNVIDGSSIWVASVAETLTALCDEVHVLAKADEINDRITSAIRALPHTIFHPASAGLSVPLPSSSPRMLSPAEACDRIEAIQHEVKADVVLVRGFDVNAEAATRPALTPHLFSYITDLPFPLSKISHARVTTLGRIAKSAARMLAQTEEARSYLEAIAPAAAGKTLIMNPMLPDAMYALRENARPSHGSQLSLVYSGKLAKDWRVSDILELPDLLRARGINATLTIIGDKFQPDPSDPTWHVRFEQALRHAHATPLSGVTWEGGLTREAASAIVASADIGLSWRSHELDSTLEISSKMLEYAAVGTVPLINFSADHAPLWGHDFPGFVFHDDTDHVADVIAALARHDLEPIREHCATVAEYYSCTRTAHRLATALERAGKLNPRTATASPPLRLTVASHDLKFMGELIDVFSHDPRIDLTIDAWQSLHRHDVDQSLRAVENSDTVICEWAGPNAVWYSHHKKTGQKLIVRIHAFELRGPWLHSIDTAAVDLWVAVSEEYRARAISRLGLDPSRVVVIPNAIDNHDLDRPKLDSPQFRIGMAGIVSFNKRPDRALDLLELLLADDPRYYLHIKGRMPWEYPYEWNTKPVQRALYEDWFTRFSVNPALRPHVVFEPFSPDIGSWLRKIGFMVSASHEESFHLAPAEGMASGAIPLVWQRKGADDVFPHECVFDTTVRIAQYVHSLRSSEAFAAASNAMKVHAQQWDISTVADAWNTHIFHSPQSTAHAPLRKDSHAPSRS